MSLSIFDNNGEMIMDIPVTIATGTAFDNNLGDTAILTVKFNTAADITYKANTKLYFYANITEGATTETVCFSTTGASGTLAAGTTPFTIGNDSSFTAAATATGKVYYYSAA